jgi:TatD DNase family protein
VPTRFFDTHAHLDGSSFAEDRDDVFARAAEAGITDLVLIGASHGFDSNLETIRIADERRSADLRIHLSLGVHPHDAAKVPADSVQRVEALAGGDDVVAVGETGLDYYYDNSPREEQQAMFRDFVQLARQLRKPLVIHTRDAEDDTLRILDEEGARDVGGIIHCFSGTAELARGALDLGFHISFSGILTFKKSEAIRDVARWMPKDRALVETDCPYLAPVPHRGKRNEPAYVVHTATKLAEVWGVDLDEVRAVTGANAAQLFGV